jgi:FimV-like protein
MLVALGDITRGRRLVNDVLENDPFHVKSLIARAAWQIRDNEMAEAINSLRSALDQDPRNSNALILLAEAQQKLGNIELAENRLAQAVEVSNSLPRIAILYARFQIAGGNRPAAARALRDSFEKYPTNLGVAALLAETQLQIGDLDGARRLLNQLIANDDPAAQALVRNLQATILFSENRIEESLSFLRSSLDEDGDGTDDLGTELQMLRIQMLSRRFDAARLQLQQLRERFPNSLALRVIEGNMLSMEGRVDEAIVLFYALLEPAFPK